MRLKCTYELQARQHVPHACCQPLFMLGVYRRVLSASYSTKLRSYNVLLNSLLFFSTCTRGRLGVCSAFRSFRMMHTPSLTTCSGALVGVSIFVACCEKKTRTQTHAHTNLHTHTHKHTQTQQRFVSSKL